MNHSDQPPNTKTPSAGRRSSAADGPPFPPSCAAPVEPESKFLFDADDFGDDGGSSSNAKRRSVSTSFHPPALPLDDGGPLALQAPIRPRSRRLFEKDQHPLSTSDVFPPSFSVQSLRDLVASYVFDGDFFSPLKILPFTEYSPGDMLSLVLIAARSKFTGRLHQHTLLRSLHDCVLFTLPPVFVTEKYLHDFDSNAMLRALPSACFENLNVLYVVLSTALKSFCDELSKLEDVLRHVKVLIVQLENRRYGPVINDELFVFDLRKTNDLVSAVANILATLNAYRSSSDVDQLLAVFAVENEQQVLLMEAVIFVDDECFPSIRHLLDHPICRWVFQLSSEQVVPSVAELSKVHCILSSSKNDVKMTGPKTAIRECDQLTWLSCSSQLPPADAFAHYRLSNLQWSPGSYDGHFPVFSGFPNLQRLQMITHSQSTPVLRLDETKRLKHLELQNLEGWEVDVGSDPVSLDFLHLAYFKGKMTRIEHLFMRDLEVKGGMQPKLLHQLCLQAENVRFEINEYTPNKADWAYAFAHAKHLRCELLYDEFLDRGDEMSFYLIATHAFSRLESLELDNSCLLLSPSFFPVLRKLSLDTCRVLVLSNVDEETKGEQPRLHFEYLEECTLKVCRIKRAGSKKAKINDSSEDNDLERIQYAFSAPNLKLLWYGDNRGSVSLFLNEASCPKLSTFRWSGTDFALLPFDVTFSLDTPIFPKLHSLSLHVTREATFMREKKVRKVPFPRLSTRLSIKSVSHLFLLGDAYIFNLIDLTLQCRWARFSEEVVKKCSNYYPMNGIMDGDAYLFEAGVSIMEKMPKIEFLIIRDIYVCPDTALVVPKSAF